MLWNQRQRPGSCSSGPARPSSLMRRITLAAPQRRVFAVVGLLNNSNLKVTKMLVDGGSGLNLISPAVINKLQIEEEELEVTGTFQGVNPGRSHPKGKITLPVTFGGELNYQTEKVVFDVVDLPLPYNRILG